MPAPAPSPEVAAAKNEVEARAAKLAAGAGVDLENLDVKRRALAERHGPRFEPAALLQDRARRGERFHRD